MTEIVLELPPMLAEFLERQVEAGVYNSVTDAVEDAVRREYEGESARLEALRAALAPGLADIEAGRVRELALGEILASARASTPGRG